MRLMMSELAHRGPDGTGELVVPHVAMGMTRLAVIDVSGGVQPLHDCAGTAGMVLNGEIYNYVELRRNLERRGHAFRSSGDAEVAVHLYEEFGVDFVTRLRGMFALAVWDSSLRTLVLARDRMGEKPLYFRLFSRAIVFASELRALTASRTFSADLDPTAVHEYFHYQYVPEPRTPLAGVEKLPAGHVMTVDVTHWRVKLAPYWSMINAPPLAGDPVEAVREQLLSLGSLVTRADVPIGVALSGGVDSSTVAAIAARSSPTPVRAFSLGYRGRPKHDERDQAKRLASVLGLAFSEIELGEQDVVDTFGELVRAWNEPIADMAGFSYLAIAKAARHHGVPVLLQGQGGDEFFWGYPWVRRALAESRRTPGRLTFYDLDPDFQEAAAACSRLYPHSWARRVDQDAPTARFATLEQNDLGVEFTRLITQTYLLSNGIAQGDRVTMFASVELRLPLVDYRLVETTIGLRKRTDDDLLEPKAWLRRAVAGLLPDTVAQRPKRPFSPPLARWHGALLRAYGWLLPDGMLVELGVLRPDAAKRLATAEFPRGAGSPLSFKALVLEAWCRTMLGIGGSVAAR
jgi:asparagine synthase (glutamine-hydrolysing)